MQFNRDDKLADRKRKQRELWGARDDCLARSEPLLCLADGRPLGLDSHSSFGRSSLSLPLRPSGRPRVKLKKRAERRRLSITWPRRRLGRRKRRSLDERVRRPSVLRGGRGLRAGATWAAARVKRRGGQAETAELAQRAARWTPPACLPESRLAASAPAAQLTLQMGDRTEEPGLLAARLVAAGWLAGGSGRLVTCRLEGCVRARHSRSPRRPLRDGRAHLLAQGGGTCTRWRASCRNCAKIGGKSRV